MHFFNLYIFFNLRKKALQDKVAKQLQITPANPSK
ncbi:MAG: hypothetical protein RL172_3065 [Bacteroidota bacterium]|jgi:hypothetical protein